MAVYYGTVIFGLALWCAVTAAHAGATSHAVLKLGDPDASTDTRLFATVLGFTASLSLVLHTLALTVGISLASGIIGIAIWDLLLMALVSRFPSPGARSWSVPELVAVAVLAGVSVLWIVRAATTIDVVGPDAAHYHVPYAMNFAHGASPFDLPATQHLYPMAASVVTAWFIAPLGTPLLADLATLLPFVVLVAAINVIFRCSTGLSGLAWATWLGLGLYLTPMFQMVSLGSADLWFTAAAVALVAAALDAWVRGQLGLLDVALLGGAAGLLVGSKATGVPAFALIAVPVVLVAIVLRRRGSETRPRVSPAALAAGVAIALGAGGLWLIRNWIQYGSPLAPAGITLGGLTIFPGETFQQSRHFSVLAEMDTSSFDLWSRTRAYLNDWFGVWLVPALGVVLVAAADLAVRLFSRDTSDRVRARFMLISVTIVFSAGLIWLLIGAPWTGLERSRGLTLRYILPVITILVTVAFIGLLPLSVPWFEKLRPARRVDLPHGIAFVIVGALIVSVVPFIANRHRAASVLYELQLAIQLRRPPSPHINDWQAAFPAIRHAEKTAGIECPSRRIYSLIRFDEPLSLQPANFTSSVYYAGRDPEANRRAGPIAPCDYVITSPAVAETDKGTALVDALGGGRLDVVGKTRDFIVMARPR